MENGNKDAKRHKAENNSEVISKDVAIKEVDRWLDYKRIKPRKRENLSDNIEAMVDAVMDGTLVLEKNYDWTHNLTFPLENDKGEVTVDKLSYKSRIMVRDINSRMKGIKAGDGDARVIGYVSALTGEPAGVLNTLDTEDQAIFLHIATFFL